MVNYCLSRSLNYESFVLTHNAVRTVALSHVVVMLGQFHHMLVYDPVSIGCCALPQRIGT